MWIVRLALDRPYTFIVFAVLILLLESMRYKPRRPISSLRSISP